MAIQNFGVTAFSLKAPPRWNVNGDGLDSLIVEMHGAASALSAYLSTLTKYSGHSGDSNMRLSDWDNDNDRQWPTVTLRYIGCRGGFTANRVKPTQDTTLQSASYSQQSGESGVTIDLQYYTGSSHAGAIASSPTSYPTAVTPSQSPQFHSASIRTRNFILGQSNVMSYFTQTTVTTHSSEELVPDVWYRTTTTRTYILIPNA